MKIKKIYIFFFWGGGGGRVGGGGVRMHVNEELKFLRRSGRGGQGGCERRIEVFVKIQKKKIYFFFGGEGLVVGVGLGGQGRCERRSEVLVKIKKNEGGGVGSGWGVRVDVNEEFKFL